jgi:hypothetical protein
MVVRVFKKYPAIKAGYLTRGGAGGEILPLVSDLDFLVITEPMHEKDMKKLIQEYRSLARITKLMDPNIEIYNEETINKQYETIHKFQYRFMEGKATWKLIYGKDYLTTLPTLPIKEIYGGFYREINTWWTQFAITFFCNTKYNDETVTRNYKCYKIVCEMVKMHLGMKHKILTFSRSEALKQAKGYSTGKEIALIEKMEKILRHRFRKDDTRIVEEAKDFLFTYLDRFYETFHDHPLACSIKRIPQTADFSEDESLLGEATKAHVDQLVSYVKKKWSHTYRGAYLVSSASFNMIDDVILMIGIDPQRLPTDQEIKEFNLFHWQIQPMLTSHIYLFLLLKNAAFRIDAVNPTKMINSTFPLDLHLRLRYRRNPFLLDDQCRRKRNVLSILSPHCAPDLFSLLVRPQSVLDGRGYQSTLSGMWTPLSEHLLRAQRMLFYELIERPFVYKIDSLIFLKIFWKTIQLVLINLSIQKGEIYYPLTLTAVLRAMNMEGMSFPPFLEILADAYRKELEGKTCDIAALIPVAVSYLKQIKIS